MRIRHNQHFEIGEYVVIADSRFAMSVSPYAWLYQELWAKYGNRIGKVIGYSNESPHCPGSSDLKACVIEFADGDTVTWETHFLEKASQVN